MNDKVEGRIIKVSPKGYGFITSESHQFIKFYFHWTGLVQETKKFPELKEGMKVKFVAQPEMVAANGIKRGPLAILIEVISD